MADSFGSLNPTLAGRQPGQSYDTALDPGQEVFFRQWLAQNKVPFDPDAKATGDYDMRGFYRGLLQQDPRATAAIDPNDNQMHYPDYWKTPAHATLSNESQWAPAGAPQWTQNDQLAQGGRVLYDDRRRGQLRLPEAGMLAPYYGGK